MDAFIQHYPRPRLCNVSGAGRPSLRQKAIDYLSDAFKEGKQILLEGKSLSARELVEAQAMANGMADGEEYLKVFL